MKRPKIYKPRNPAKKKFELKKTSDKERQSWQKLYHCRKWRNFRYRFLHENPRCFCCKGRANVADHIVAHKGDETLFYKVDNFIPLCSPCHNYITGKFDRHRDQKLVEKMMYIKKRREINGVTSKVIIVPFKV